MGKAKKTKIVICFMACIFSLIWIFKSLADENNVISSRYRDDAYAWTFDKVYFSHGYYTNDDAPYQRDFWPIHYDVYCVDKTNGNAVLILENMRADRVQLFTDNNNLYIVKYEFNSYKNGTSEWDSYITTKWESNCTVITYSLLEEQIKSLHSVVLSEYINDIAIYCEKLYIITTDGIYRLDDDIPCVLYVFEGNSMNSLNDNHMIIDDGILYFQEDNIVRSLNLSTENTRSEVVINDMDNRSIILEIYDQKRYNYIVIDGVIYYYDAKTGITMSYDCELKKSSIASLSGYHFLAFTDDIIKVRVVKHDSSLECSSTDYLLYLNANDKHSKFTQKLVDRESIPVGNNRYTVPIGVDTIIIDKIDILEY